MSRGEMGARGSPSGAGSGEAGSGGGPGARIDAALARVLSRRRVGVMTHIVLGYPGLEESERIVDRMVLAGVDMIEVQIPFSDPTADGPVITAACQEALEGGVRVADALEFMGRVAGRHEIPFLFMTYANVAFSYRGGEARGGGIRRFVGDAASAGASGLIIPDLPPESREEGYTEACRVAGVHPIYVVSPNVPDRRLRLIKEVSSGFVYSTSRTGTTGKEMDLEREKLFRFLDRARKVLDLPIAVGFSLSTREHIDALEGHAEIGVVGTHLIRVYQRSGLEALEKELIALVG